ncbi:MAG: hypothetical protein A2Y74_05680 [Actinobacteria bacterium RBG_13_63_9]|nr:MAG: hypothetical protein A2Y74_05680 [Actinobacteria bacterium RBG_13_63_9]
MPAVELRRFESLSRYDEFCWTPSPASLRLLADARDILATSPRRMTVRQLYYRLVARLVIPNNVRSYQNLVSLLTKARKSDAIAADKFVDRARSVVKPYGYRNLASYVNTIRNGYTRRPNDGQPHYVEVWTEKDALSAIIADAADPYGATVVVSKGYSSYTLLVEAAERFRRQIGRRDEDVGWVHLLYFGDFDPSGEDIFRVIGAELRALTGYDHFAPEKVALTREQIDRHNLPPMPTKSTDSRTFGFRVAHGDEAVELDALPPEELERVVVEAVEQWFSWNVREQVLETEKRESAALGKALAGLDDLLTGEDEEDDSD